MIKFDVRLLLVRLNHLERFEKELRGNMKPEERPMEPQLSAMGRPMWHGTDANAFMTREGIQWVGAYILPMRDEIKPLELAASDLQISHVWNHADRWTRLQLADGFSALRWTIEQEMNEKFFMYLNKEDALLYEESKPFGAATAAHFPLANEELKYSAKCIVCGLGTAAVFYSMRAVENGIKALAIEVGRSYSTQNWQNIINEIEAEISNYRKNGIPGLSKEEKDAKLEFLSRAAIQIAYFKDGWRNYVSHNKKPYDEIEARSVYNHVGAFMNIISERLSE